MVETFCDASDAAKAVTLLALRLIDGSLRPIAVGSCFRIDASSAEVAFAVDDHFQNKGLGTVLLDRLAGLASAHGFTRFEAVTLSDNAAMLTMFHESGFEIHSKSERGGVSVQLSLDPTGRAIAAAERRDAVATVASLHPLLEPASVAVVGASRDPHSIGGRVLRALIAGGFDGRSIRSTRARRSWTGCPAFRHWPRFPAALIWPSSPCRAGSCSKSSTNARYPASDRWSSSQRGSPKAAARDVRCRIGSSSGSGGTVSAWSVPTAWGC